MKIHIQVLISNELVKEHTLEIEEQKVSELTEDELREAIEINVRSWADKEIEIAWEVERD